MRGSQKYPVKIKPNVRMLLWERVAKLCITKPKNYLEFKRLVILKEQLKPSNLTTVIKKVGRGVPPALLAEFVLNSPTQDQRRRHYTLRFI